MEESINKNLSAVINEQFGTGKWKTIDQSVLSLAFLGDCVFDLVIRSVVLTHDGGTNKFLHKKCTSVVNAAAQARLIEAIEPELTPEENAIFHRGRNAKSGSSAKNASIADYRKATGLETLIGYLYLEGDYDRLVYLIKTGLNKTGKLIDEIDQ